ncbi:MAG: winged helix-turn-helix transcriptional regulator [Proteobacteria bacterium]|nr:winged helix-turn-helix transcriptional regulator [Pseudomonadota bacterium]MCP4920767.1 winged helix-turn-helix transcriptional regulator [Pseudomonadota bacterium]
MNDERLGELTKALGHPVRVRILKTLMSAGCCVGDLVDQIPLAQSTISQHLRVLKDAGLVMGTVDGPRRCYCTNPAVLQELAAAITSLVPETDPCASTSTCPPQT